MLSLSQDVVEPDDWCVQFSSVGCEGVTGIVLYQPITKRGGRERVEGGRKGGRKGGRERRR